jgi:hypothetical protein
VLTLPPCTSSCTSNVHQQCVLVANTPPCTTPSCHFASSVNRFTNRVRLVLATTAHHMPIPQVSAQHSPNRLSTLGWGDTGDIGQTQFWRYPQRTNGSSYDRGK